MDRPTYELSSVYNESEIPTVTFVQPKEFGDLVGSLLTKGKHVTLCGPSGCGKTTLVRKALDRAKLGNGDVHWMSGRDHASKDTAIAVFASEFGCESEWTETLSWMKAAGVVVLDDFHHLKKSVRDEIGRSLKRWHERDIRLLLIGIAESTHELLDLDPELGIRNDPYEMKTQTDTFISEVITLGENALNIKFSDATRRQFVTGAKGIPSAIHVICRVACLRNDIFGTTELGREISTTMQDIKDGVIRIYKGKYQNKVIGLAKGKQQARSVHNTYFQIIRHICLLDQSEVSAEELRARIVATESDAGERNRKNTSLHNCLNNLQDVISERGLGDAVYYDANSRTISIEDPSFRLYLSLMDLDMLERAVRVRKGTYPWDVAISFAGEQRHIAERLRDLLNDAGYTVFYDFDQQHLLWGQNLRKKLGDVYANEAQYMIVLLSKEYPEKEWPSFELEVGKDARTKRTESYLLPVIVDDVHVVGLSRDVGHLDLRRVPIEQVASVLIDRIEASAAGEASGA